MTDVECEGGEGKLDIAEMTERISEQFPSLQVLEPGPEPLAPAFFVGVRARIAKGRSRSPSVRCHRPKYYPRLEQGLYISIKTMLRNFYNFWRWSQPFLISDAGAVPHL